LPGSVSNLTNYNSIAIDALDTYNVTVPPGGFITIRWNAQ
jgi:hypothetical protein